MSAEAPNSSTKRNFFKKPAWVIEKQLQSAREASQLFERADDCHASIVAERERRKKAKEEKAERARQAEQEKKEEEEERKKRKRKELMARTLSEAFPDTDSPAESLPPPKRKATVIELDDSDDEAVQSNEHDAEYITSNNLKTSSADGALLDSSINFEEADASIDVDGTDLQISVNPLSNASIVPNAQNDTTVADPLSPDTANEANPVLDILIDTRIPNTRPLVVKRYYRDNLRPVRKTWCEKQGFSAEQAKHVILTWRRKRLFDVANCKSLGIELDSCGEPVIKSGTDGYDDKGDKIVFVATTYELYTQEQKAAEDASKRNTEPDVDEKELASKEEQIRIVLRAKDRKESRIAVRPVRTDNARIDGPILTANKDTTFARIANAFRRDQNLESEKELTLLFDGEELAPDVMVKDSEIEDRDYIDVRIK